ncbi:MAG: DHHW family protein [Ruminococcus callidus]
MPCSGTGITGRTGRGIATVRHRGNTRKTGCYHRGEQSRSQRAKSPLQAETAAPDHQPHRCRCADLRHRNDHLRRLDLPAGGHTPHGIRRGKPKACHAARLLPRSTGQRRLCERPDALLRGHRPRTQQLQAHDQQTGKLSGLTGRGQGAVLRQHCPRQKEETADADSRTTTTAPVASGNRSTETTTATTVVTEPEPDPVEIGDGIVLVDKRAISIYGGSFSRGEKYATTLNEYKKQLGSKVNVYSLVAPTAVSFYLPDSYAGYTGSEPDNIDHIDENLKDVKAVDAYAALAAHTDEDIYARTDHHWLPLGAYYAAEAFAKTANVSFAPLSGYTKTTLSGYLGSMYTFTKSAVLQENPEDFTYYTPHNQYTTQYYDTNFTNERDGKLLISLDNVEPVSWYLVFMGGDEKITHVKTDVTNKRTLVIVKDSYGNALVPYLTQSFSDIYVIDMRYFDLNAVSFMQQVGATDVLFAMNTFSATGGNSECLETIRTQ